jgi:iron complex outermembrane recepter protein
MTMITSVTGKRARLAATTSAPALAFTLAMAAMPSHVLAQAAAPAAESETTEIVVTGFKAALDNAAKLKKNTISIVESVSAEDIGKLPDVSIADSLARLPGVTAQRLEGRDQRLSIRGLGPDFGVTLLNGREQVTVGDNRGVEYDQYPSEFFRNVVVFKSPQANLVPAGISGTVDLRMLRPLDQKERILAVAARGQFNGQKALNPDSPRAGFRASGIYADKFANDTLGIAIGVSATNSPSQNERYNAWGFPDFASGNVILGGAKPYVQSNKLERYGAVATVEYAPTDTWHTTIDLLYSKFKETQKLRGIEFPINPGWGAGTTVSNITASNGFITGATVSGVHAVQRNDLNKRDAENFSGGINSKIALNDKINFTFDGSYSRATRTDFLLETYTGTGYNTAGAADTVTLSQNADGTFRIVPTLDYTQTTGPNRFLITDPRGWGYNGTDPVVQAGFLNRPSFKDELFALRGTLDGEIDFGPFKGWEAGANFSRRKKTSKFTSFFLCPRGAGTNCTVSSGTLTSVPVPDAAKIGTNVALDYLGVPAMLTLDPLYIYNNVLNPVFDNRPVSLVRDNSIAENVYTGYIMGKIDDEVGGLPLRGSMGVQIVHTNQSSDGSISNFVNVGGVPQVTIAPVSGSAKYTYILPSMALSLEAADNVFVKFGASQSQVRARLDQLRVNQEFNFNLSRLGSTDPGNSVFSSTGGNVNLRPYQSTNIDLSFERYFPGSGYISLALYFKNLTKYIDSNQSFIYDFAPGLSVLTPAQRAIVGTTLGKVNAPDNAGGGNLKGMEITLSLPFKNINEALDGFGFFGSGSYTQSEIKLDSNPGSTITLPGLSKWVGNAEVYFEKYGFQTRLSYRYRSSFLAEVAGLSANPTFRTAKSEGILDVQVGYEFQEGSFLHGLSVLAQAKNLTDRPFVTFENNDPRRVIDYQRYGRDFYLGAIYKF